MREIFVAAVILMMCSCSWNRQDILVAAKDLKAGQRIEKTDIGEIITAKFFGDKFPADVLHQYSEVLGRTLKRDVPKGDPILGSELR